MKSIKLAYLTSSDQLPSKMAKPITVGLLQIVWVAIFTISAAFWPHKLTTANTAKSLFAATPSIWAIYLARRAYIYHRYETGHPIWREVCAVICVLSFIMIGAVIAVWYAACFVW